MADHPLDSPPPSPEAAFEEAVRLGEEALAEAVRAALALPGPQRFARATAIAALAGSLRRQRGKGAADLARPGGFVLNPAPRLNNIVGIGDADEEPDEAPAYNDSTDLMRQALGAQLTVARSQQRAARATELRDLVDAQRGLKGPAQKKTLQPRIDQLLAEQASDQETEPTATAAKQLDAAAHLAGRAVARFQRDNALAPAPGAADLLPPLLR